MLLKEGQILNNTYEVDRFLGEGAFAEVYRVKHKYLGRQALKIFKTASSSQREIEDKLTEAVMLSRIGHPNIIRVFDAGIMATNTGKFGYFSMEYVAGGNLESFWQSYRSNYMPIHEVIDIIKQILTGLAVAHSENPPIVHRDIKSQNILVGYDANGMIIKIGDFGLAKKVNPLTLLASAAGTPSYKPPEFISNYDSCAGDVWAVGVIMYLLLTNKLPFPVYDLLDFSGGKAFLKPLIPCRKLNVKVPAKLDDIIAQALALSVNDRYSDANKFRKALSIYKSGCESSDFDRKTTDIIQENLKSTVVRNIKSNDIQLERAFALSRNANKIMEAADLLEEILSQSPELRDKYEYHLRLWRRGIVM